jgi:hypothetical protein
VNAAGNSTYHGYPELWILRYPSQRYHAVPSPEFEATTLWLRVRHPNHSATTLHSDLAIRRYLMPKTSIIRACFAIGFGLCLFLYLLHHAPLRLNHLTLVLLLLPPINFKRQCGSLLGSLSSSMRTTCPYHLRSRTLKLPVRPFSYGCQYSIHGGTISPAGCGVGNGYRFAGTQMYYYTSLVATMVRHVERKALQIHNLYVVVIKGTKNLLHSLCPVVTLHGGIGPCVENGRHTFMIFRTHTCHFYSYLLKESH